MTGFLLFCKTPKIRKAMRLTASLQAAQRPLAVAADAWNRLSDEDKTPFEEAATALNALMTLGQVEEPEPDTHDPLYKGEDCHFYVDTADLDVDLDDL